MRGMETFAMRFPRSVLEVILTDKMRSEEIGESVETENVTVERKQARICDKDDVTTTAKSGFSNHRADTEHMHETTTPRT
jgi:hypothetical protein